MVNFHTDGDFPHRCSEANLLGGLGLSETICRVLALLTQLADDADRMFLKTFA